MSRYARTTRSRTLGLTAAVFAAALALTAGAGAGPGSAATPDTHPGTGHAAKPALVGYLPNYKGSWETYARTIDFSTLTDLNLAFATTPTCDGACTAGSDMTFSFGQSDAGVRAVVRKAHREGVRVIASVGGGGGDQSIIQFYRQGLSKPLARSLSRLVEKFDLDGVDLDIEDPDHMGQQFADFTDAVVQQMHPRHKLVTAAVAPYLQPSMPDAALHQFDRINVMNYSNLTDATNALLYYSVDKGYPKDRMTLGVPFFGNDDDWAYEEDYSTILEAYPDAWQHDSVSGGTLDGGVELHYVGEATMAREAQLGAMFGGVMVWELTGDASGPHSLMSVITSNMAKVSRR